MTISTEIATPPKSLDLVDFGDVAFSVETVILEFTHVNKSYHIYIYE